MEPIQLIIVDDHVIFLNSLVSLLKEEPLVRIVETAENGKELLEILPKKSPDIILMDLDMPKINGIETLKFIYQLNRNFKIIVLSSHDQGHLVNEVKSLGAKGYLHKTCSKDDLLNAIKIVHGGGTVFIEEQDKKPVSLDIQDAFLQRYKISKRELEVIRCIKQNLTNQQIADKLFLSIYTVETHRKNIMAKLEVKKTAALVKFAIEHNL